MQGLASLIAAARPRLADLLAAAPFVIEEIDDGHCRVTTDGFTLHLYARQSGGLIDSSIELACVPAHAVPFTEHLHSWLVLKSRGEDWPVVEPEVSAPAQLAHELDRIERVLPIVRDETMLREALLWRPAI